MNKLLCVLLLLTVSSGCSDQQPDQCAPLTDQVAQQICYQTAEMKREHRANVVLRSVQSGTNTWQHPPVNYQLTPAAPLLNVNPVMPTIGP